MKIQHDGLAVAKWLKEVKQVGVLGIHGESLGGFVASYIASKMPVDFVFCDRTFSSLYDVAYNSYGNVARSLFRMFTKWECSSVNNFLNAECYKLISADPNDNIIPNAASLKSGVSHALVK